LASAIQILITYLQSKSVPKKQWIFFAMVAVFGGFTLLLHDEKFIMWKPTVVYSIFALIIFGSQLMGKPAIKAMLGEALELPDKIWGRVNAMWGLFFSAAAVANLYVANNFSEDVWVNFKVFGMTVASIVLTIITIISVFKYLPKDQEEGKE
ncbi:MAG: septation protein IspZ, partial [Cohaesibacter sp.]|nr:septation protein IspZ [Cohaesibacter sp.]